MPYRSRIWRYFIRDSGNNGGICKLCHKRCTGRTTTILWTHLRKFHGIANNINGAAAVNVGTKSKLTVPRPSTSSQPEPESECHEEGKANAINRFLIHLISNNMGTVMSQFSTIESLIKFLAPAQKVPSRSEVLDMIDETAQKAREKLKQTVSNVGSLSLTMYLWEDFVNQYTYYGLNAHYVDENFSSRVVHLKTTQFYSFDHTSDVIAAELLRICADWGIDTDRVVAVTHNAEAVFREAVELAFSKQKSIPCMADTLDLVAHRILQQPAVKSIAAKVFNHLHFEDYRYPTELYEVMLGLRPFRDASLGCDPRAAEWNCLYYKLKNVLSWEEKRLAAATPDPDEPEIVTHEEMLVMRDVVPLLHILHRFSRRMEIDYRTRASQIIPLVKALRHLASAREMVTAVGKSSVTILLEECELQWGSIESHPVISVAALLDPRWKTFYYRDAAAYDRAVACVEKTLLEMGDIAEPAVDPDQSDAEDKCSEDHFSEDELTESDTEDACPIRNYLKQQRKTISGSPLKRYLDKRLIPPSHDPLKFWKRFDGSKGLTELAKKYLSVLAVATPVEKRDVSGAGRVDIPKDDETLTPERLSNILFLRYLTTAELGFEDAE